MKRSALTGGLVPAGVVTVTLTVPVPAGAVAMTDVGETTVTPVASTVPKSTVAPGSKLSPLIVTDVPPPVVPWLGETPVTTGIGSP